MSAHKVIVRWGSSDTVAVVGSGGAVQIGDTALTGTEAGAGTWRIVDDNGQASLVHVARAPEGVWLHAGGAVFLLELGAGGTPSRSRPTAHDADMSAPMPATVLSIVAAEGTRVSAGDVLLLLEAMKMELPIRAPRDGVVSTVRCREGELVQPGVPLVELA
jgi:biotin carboxyl carrier protein